MTRTAASAGVVLLLAAGSASPQAPAAGGGHGDLRTALTAAAERTLLPERCGECHAAEFEVWETTAHAGGFDTLHRRDRAKEIYRSLGLRLIRRGADETTPSCLSCHYTPVLRRGELRAGAGVTCESCHGPARDWVSVHNDYGVAEADFQRAATLETPEYRARRVAASREAGMRRPSDLYDVAANCFGCHTVPKEELVNAGGHSTGSDFEIVAWSERIRHNFLDSYRTADGRANAERSREWKRRMYVVGRALDVEYAVRGLAAATRQDELYFAAMSDRAGAAVDELLEIADRVDLPAIRAILAAWDAVDVSIGDPARLRAAADLMQASTRQFIAASDGAALAALDPLWDPTVEDPAAPARVTEVSALPAVSLPVDWDPAEGGAAAESAATAPGGGGSGRGAAAEGGAATPGGRGGGGDPAAAADAAAVASAATRPTATRPAASRAAPESAPRVSAPRRTETLTRPPWRDPPAHAFVKVPCGRCHNAQERWWRRDPHSNAARPFRANEPRNVEIAEAYGVAAGDMARGDRMCMSCHGTPVSAPSRKVRAGVGCQRCHGAGAGYLEPHETAGYAGALALGMTDLRDPAVQAATCASCHYVNDPGLAAAGHPVGDGFDVRARIGDIVHWGTDFGGTRPVDPEALAAAYADVVAARGPAPAVATPPRAPAPPGAPAAAAPGSPPPQDARARAPRPPSGRAAGGRAGSRPVSGRRAGAGAGARPAAAEGLGTPAAPLRPPRSGAPRSDAGEGRGRRDRPAPVDDPGLDAPLANPRASVEEMLDVLRARIENLYRVLRGESE